jgi:phage N-6-adenine-methyltransferase|tara:strand:- start:8915 stop:9430 length:516 start_codon:yes stop_codon:yes gene_type:complete
MANFNKNRFSSTKQDWTTPQDMFTALNNRYQFDFDLAADETNKKCENYFSKKNDALLQDWQGNCWLNPPYGSKGKSRLSKWVEKAFNESRDGSCAVTMLIPARTNTLWWGSFCMKATEILFVIGRPKFGDAIHGLPQPLAIVTFGSEILTKYGSYHTKTCTVEFLKDDKGE